MTDSGHPPGSRSHRHVRSLGEPPEGDPGESKSVRPGRVEIYVRKVDRFQQGHGVLGFPFAVFQKFGNDQAGSKAALIAYYGLFALFPFSSSSRPLSAMSYTTTRSCKTISSTVPWEASRSSALS